MRVVPVLTMHRQIPHELVDTVLTGVEAALLDAGASRVWIDSSVSPDAVVMAELPERAVQAPAAG
ncbi:hypothetical protein [Nocardioides deserti]|uniref:Uncharacterized protein n=1 Tax=Nocardioides deserti TaxID=1588644 RepID=A0ABR6U397_9ACTN|nr:hypothetical protein [Nocardioides deserti]MBC2958874.1 hypothetical protein [Nocardioides deserti]GGO69396.1 hypothetical protein GCM10012276_05490 [Nocardioides deserti]